MRILRIIYDWPPPWLGLAPAPYEITKAQEKRGDTFDIFCGRWPNAGDLETLPNCNFHPIFRAPFQGTISFTSSVVLFFKYLSWRKSHGVDMIHSHGHFAIWIYLYRYLLEKYMPWVDELKTPLVVQFHNTVKGRSVKLEDSNSPVKPVSKYIDWPMAEMSDRWAVKCADACVFVSRDLMEEAIKYYHADPAKCFVVETGVNIESFTPQGPEEKAKTRIELKFNPEDKILLYVGALTERKNIHLILEAMLLLPKNYKFMIMGSGDPSYEDKLTLFIAEHKIHERVLRISYTPYPQVPIAYQTADLMVLPSSFEGLPKAAMESLACGLQVLAAGFKIDRDIAGIEYLENLEVQNIASKIQNMIQNPRQVDVHLIRKYYSWEVKAYQMSKVYEKAVEFHEQ